MDPPLPASYIGNANLFTVAEHRVADLIADFPERPCIATIANTALAVRKAVNAVNPSFCADRLALQSRLVHARGTKNAVDFEYGTGMFMSNWYEVRLPCCKNELTTYHRDAFGADNDWGIIGTPPKDGRPDCIRKPYSTNDGVCTVMPRRGAQANKSGCEDVPWVVQVGLRNEHMDNLCKVTELRGIATRVIY